MKETLVPVSLPLGLAHRPTHNALLWNGYLCLDTSVFLTVLVRCFEFYFSCFVDKTLQKSNVRNIQYTMGVL